MWGTDATATVTLLEGQVTIFAAIDHCTAECVGIHAAMHGDRFEALEPLRQGVRDHFGGIAAAVGDGARAATRSRQRLSERRLSEPRCAFLGMTSSPAFVRQPEGNGCIERFFRTLKEQLLWVRHFRDVEELRQAPPGVQGDVQPGVADRATRLSIAGAGASGVCGQARGLITINALSNTRGPGTVMEALFSTVKNEIGEWYESHGDAKAELFDYIEVFYNQRRRHSSAGRMSPAAYERRLTQAA